MAVVGLALLVLVGAACSTAKDTKISLTSRSSR